MQEGVLRLLGEAGIKVSFAERQYRPTVSFADCDAKLMKPQSVVEMLDIGSRDLGFAGADWVTELGASLVELLDTGLDPVRIVAAASQAFIDSNARLESEFIVVSEYEKLTRMWLERRRLNGRFVRSFGATEVYPPDDADCIVDNTATGSTLRANGLVVFDELMRSSTRLYACPRSLDQPEKRARIEHFILLVRSVIDARKRVVIEVNIPGERLNDLLGVLPAMREPTIAPLHHEAGFAVKAAVPRRDLPELIRRIKEQGGTDIVVFEIAQIVP